MSKLPIDDDQWDETYGGSGRARRDVATKDEGYPVVNPLNGKLYYLDQKNVHVQVVAQPMSKSIFAIPLAGAGEDMKNKIISAVLVGLTVLAVPVTMAIWKAAAAGEDAVEAAKAAAADAAPDAGASGVEKITDGASNSASGTPEVGNVASSSGSGSSSAVGQSTKNPTQVQAASPVGIIAQGFVDALARGGSAMDRGTSGDSSGDSDPDDAAQKPAVPVARKITQAYTDSLTKSLESIPKVTANNETNETPEAGPGAVGDQVAARDPSGQQQETSVFDTYQQLLQAGLLDANTQVTSPTPITPN